MLRNIEQVNYNCRSKWMRTDEAKKRPYRITIDGYDILEQLQRY